jgi:hypothetical protein
MIEQTTFCVFEKVNGVCRCVRGGCGREVRGTDDCASIYAQCRGTGPGIIQKAANLAKATAEHVATGAKTVSDEEAARRSAICLGCNLFVKENGSGYCAHKSCGCQTVGVKEFMAKQRWEESKCPHPAGDKWRMTDEQLAECGHPEVTE